MLISLSGTKFDLIQNPVGYQVEKYGDECEVDKAHSLMCSIIWPQSREALNIDNPVFYRQNSLICEVSQ